jgi:hypothetical protein
VDNTVETGLDLAVVGSVVAWDVPGGAYVLDDRANSSLVTVGLVKSIKGTKVTVTSTGTVTGQVGLSPGASYFNSDTPGAYGTTTDTAERTIFVGVAVSATEMLVGVELNAAGVLPSNIFSADGTYTGNNNFAGGLQVAGTPVLDAVWPVGITYTQYPGKQNPTELGLPGTWTNISSEFAGDFFRAEGVNALAFEGGQQGEATAVNGLSLSTDGSHSHSGSTNSDTHHHDMFLNNGASTSQLSNNSQYAAAFGFVEETRYYQMATHSSGTWVGRTRDDAHSHSLSINSNGGHSHTVSGDTETRPVNRTIRIWERTA